MEIKDLLNSNDVNNILTGLSLLDINGEISSNQGYVVLLKEDNEDVSILKEKLIPFFDKSRIVYSHETYKYFNITIDIENRDSSVLYIYKTKDKE